MEPAAMVLRFCLVAVVIVVGMATRTTAAEPSRPVRMGAGAMTFDTVPGWGLGDDGRSQIGPTHGGVVVDKAGNVYTSSNLGIFVFTPDGGPLNGTAIDVAVTVQQVRERDLPAADDDFAQLASEFDTIDELRGDLRSRVERTKRIEQAYVARQKVEEVLMNSVTIDLPENIISEQVEAHFADGHGPRPSPWPAQRPR
jgi:hypothetical protein